MNVVIVEDEIRIREGIEKLLLKLNRDYHIIGTAENGAEGLELIREKKPDIVVTDIRMPIMDGLEMLEKMSAEGIQTKAVVLSAYSDFEYARSAMKWGVTEYLLKPTSLTDFAQAMEHAAEQALIVRSRKPAEIGSTEQVFRDLLAGRMNITLQVEKYLGDNYGIAGEDRLMLIVCCLGRHFAQNAAQCRAILESVLSVLSGARYIAFDSPYRKSVAAVIYGCPNTDGALSVLQSRLGDFGSDTVVGCTEAVGAAGLHEAYDRLFPYMDWNISMDEPSLICYPQIAQIKTESCIYPAELDNRIRSALCAYDSDAAAEAIREFHSRFRCGKIYHPREIKDCYIRFLWLIIAVIKELGGYMDEGVDRQMLLSDIMDAKTRRDLESITEGIMRHLSPAQDDGSISHLTVKKAVALVREFYADGITLDEISRQLRVTPEYLGTLFHRETGTSFSAYIRNVRMDKAKELLCGTQLKLYEVAQKSGYSDAKYFSKVFRESEGMSPADYRKQFHT